MNTSTKHNESLKIFGRSLRQIRKERRLSQEDLALICSLDRTYISGLECAKRNPTIKVVSNIAEKLGVNLSDLFSEIKNTGIRSEKNS